MNNAKPILKPIRHTKKKPRFTNSNISNDYFCFHERK